MANLLRIQGGIISVLIMFSNQDLILNLSEASPTRLEIRLQLPHGQNQLLPAIVQPTLAQLQLLCMAIPCLLQCLHHFNHLEHHLHMVLSAQPPEGQRAFVQVNHVATCHGTPLRAASRFTTLILPLKVVRLINIHRNNLDLFRAWWLLDLNSS